MTSDEQPASLETERLTLRPWTADDAPEFFEILRRREITDWLGDPEPIADLDEARRRIAEVARTATARVPRSRAIVPHTVGRAVGSAILGHLPGEDDEVQLGWFLHPDHTGNGWATEAASAVLEEALANGHPRIWADMWPHNHASAAICLRLGMIDLGEVDDPWYGTVEYPTSRMFCVEHPDGGDGRRPRDILAERWSHAVLEHATVHPPT